MKKIKKFKINVRAREIMRLLKSAARIREVTPQMEEAVRGETEHLGAILAPAAVYETVPRERVPRELAVSPPEQWVAASVYLATIGAGAGAEVRDAQQRGEQMRSAMLHAIAVEALAQAGNFVYRLVNEEAKEDECELSKEQALAPEQQWQPLTGILPGDKVGVRFSGGAFDPLYSSCGIMYWIPRKKRNPKSA